MSGGLLYRSDEDRRRFLGLVAELPERMGTEVHAFVLMPNHYHLCLVSRIWKAPSKDWWFL